MEQLTLLPKVEKNTSFSSICRAIGCEGNLPGWPDQFGNLIKSLLLKNKITPIRTLSLFSGAGGLDIGFSDIGFQIIESVEIEKEFCKTLELNSGKGKRFNESTVNSIDIRKYSAKHIQKIDFVIGGPPCQTFSAAGRRANGVLGINDERGVLFREYVRLLKDLSPRGFLFENVYGIVGAQNGEAWSEILQSFSAIGYNLFYRILDAADYGVPQHRERLIIVGLKEGLFKFPRPTHGPDSIDNQPFYTAKTAVEGVFSTERRESNQLRGRYARLLDNIPPGLNYSFYTEKMGHPTPVFAWRSKFSDFLYKADPNEPVRTIKANGGAYTGPFHWDNRFFTYEEYKRLQTFPDDYNICGNKQTATRQIGNSVPPQLARILAIAIRQQVFGTVFPFQLSLLESGETLSFRKRKSRLTIVYKKKAEMAIKVLKKECHALPKSHEYFCSMSNRFRFALDTTGKGDFKVSVLWKENLVITISDVEQYETVFDPVFVITIESSEKKWNLGVNQVRLIVNTKKIIGYTIAWKAFELELINNNIKADLIQLNGYYQYEPKLMVSAVIKNNVPYVSVLRNVLGSRSVPNLRRTKDLSDSWGMKECDVFKAAKYLRSLGYEIRNHSTNPQIAQDYWLIPYVFPTLTPQSVQLTKHL